MANTAPVEIRHPQVTTRWLNLIATMSVPVMLMPCVADSTTESMSIRYRHTGIPMTILSLTADQYNIHIVDV